ncbi:hypothetical protein [Streptomyces griseomycini]|uniref:Uncharacterized protein n=1 Tax=Streptomyces griseomycini TaxID=66895 RepID=A0A7W7PS93_9ACTN|nr:hypothetical protein [Streptomyces griseomycini]MBB4899703.1 hypothetical protein [Streptomyces griseomycini]GGP97510.1 hypothetical protein GCM10010266_20980 [Streptomyces griseomycini]GGR07238.1 hypothetical protein GCM10015536_10340 [Streptomyces griseomycini]
MNTTGRAAAPIYDRLIAERGDVVAVAALTAEETRREVAAVLDFGFSSTGGETDEDE